MYVVDLETCYEEKYLGLCVKICVERRCTRKVFFILYLVSFTFSSLILLLTKLTTGMWLWMDANRAQLYRVANQCSFVESENLLVGYFLYDL